MEVKKQNNIPAEGLREYQDNFLDHLSWPLASERRDYAWNDLEESQLLFKCYGTCGINSKGHCRNPSERLSHMMHLQIKLLDGLCEQDYATNFNLLQRWLTLCEKTN